MKNVLVTGVSGDIGSKIAKSFYAGGDTVHGLYRVRRLNDVSFNFMQYRCDLSKWYEIETVFETERLGEEVFDLVVVAHGEKPAINEIENLEAERVESIINGDLLGAAWLSQMIVPRMKTNGTIIFISSIHAISSYPYRVPYAAAKSGIVGLARGLAVELAGRGITVNTICPGQVEGARTDSVADASIRRAMLERVPGGRFVDVTDICETIRWLMKTRSVTGQAIVLDYGLTSSSYYHPYPTQEER